jgi:hypothetical protein
MTLFQILILFTNHYGNLQEMLEMASFLKYVDLYLTSELGRFYLGHPIHFRHCNQHMLSQIISKFCTVRVIRADAGYVETASERNEESWPEGKESVILWS